LETFSQNRFYFFLPENMFDDKAEDDLATPAGDFDIETRIIPHEC
jgi:hypothetical protein